MQTFGVFLFYDHPVPSAHLCELLPPLTFQKKNRYVLFFTGLAHITLPNSTSEAWVRGGRNGLIIAADTAAVSTLGHITTYPSEKETLGLVVQTAGGEVPPHVVLHEGACCTGETLV